MFRTARSKGQGDLAQLRFINSPSTRLGESVMRALQFGLIFIGIALSGCAEDHYTVIPDGAGSEARLRSDLRDCKDWAIREHFRRQPEANAALNFFGAIGGAISAATQPAENNPNLLTEQCMREHGYNGTSSG